jgi:hypothetical protein
MTHFYGALPGLNQLVNSLLKVLGTFSSLAATRRSPNKTTYKALLILIGKPGGPKIAVVFYVF